MAKNTTTRTYYEAVIGGSPKAVRGLLAGLAIGQELEAPGWYHEDEDIAPSDRSASMRRVAEKMHLLPVSEVRAVISAPLAKLLRARAKMIAAHGICEVVAIKRIKQASVEVRYHTFAKRYDDEVRALLKDLPRGAKLQSHDRVVETDKEAIGMEAYTAVHEFEASGTANLVGRIDVILDLRNRLDVHPLIECGEIDLQLA